MTFTSPVTRACVDIVIIDDNDIEGDHNFGLLINAVVPGSILIPSAFITITINDNLGKLVTFTLPSLIQRGFYFQMGS